MSAEIMQLLQLILLVISVMLVTYCVVHFIRSQFTGISHQTKEITLSEVFAYFKKLTVRNYECYHKYQIWRIYRYS
jgi:hypothetical protein